MEQPKEKWMDSAAKQEITLLILAEMITRNDDLDALYESSLEYMKFEKKNFKRNVKALFKALAEKEERAQYDTAAVLNDRQVNPRPTLTHGGYPFWDTSAAKVLLAQDIKDGLDKDKTKDELWNSREEYKVFPSDIFKQHVFQERLKGVQTSYSRRSKTNINRFP